MEKNLTHKNSVFCNRNGFALISSLMIMMLLMLVALAMLSLSSSSVSSAKAGKGISEAKANARMALMFAIGELQTHTGNDTRITAPADIVESDAPPLTGVWRSWEGENHDDAGRPIKPDYSSKGKSSESGDGRFLSWLVSGAQPGQAPLSPAPSALVYKNDAISGTISLLSGGTLGYLDPDVNPKVSNPGQVHVPLQPIVDGDDLVTGSYAWWVSPENQKARLIQPQEPRTDDAAGWVEMGQSHTVPNAEIFGIGASGPVSKALTLDTTEFLANASSAKPQQSFHNLSTSSVGLLTNSATGGWRKDMSILTEKWGKIPNENGTLIGEDGIYDTYPGGRLPLFRIKPEAGSVATTQVPRPTSTNHDPEQSNLYPWSEYSTIIGYKQPGTYYAASASWASLQSFATSYKNFSSSSGVVKSPFVWDKIAKNRASSIATNEMYNHKHRQRLHPQIARLQVLVLYLIHI